jgi:hypothetical protein
MPGKNYSLRSVKAEQLTFDPSKPVNPDSKATNTNAQTLADWAGGYVDSHNGQPQVVVTSRLGAKVANVGDYVVELSPGNFTVMTERDFSEVYNTDK